MVMAGAFGSRCHGFNNSTGEGWAGAGLGWDRGMHEHLGGALLVSASSSISLEVENHEEKMRNQRGRR